MTDTNDLILVESDTKLSSALSFAQFLLPLDKDKVRLITLIGEQHENSFTCKGEQVSISQYTISVLEDNPSSKVLLEIDPSFIKNKADWPRSVPIREILGKLHAKKQVIGFDERNYWLGADAREDLYHDRKKMLSLSEETLIKRYVSPFYEKKKSFHLEDSYNSKVRKYLAITYPAYLKSTMDHITNQIKKHWKSQKRAIIILLMHVYKQLVDWYILKELFCESSVDSIIVVMGEQHRLHISTKLKELGVQSLSSLSRNDKKCLSLLHTERI